MNVTENCASPDLANDQNSTEGNRYSADPGKQALEVFLEFGVDLLLPIRETALVKIQQDPLFTKRD